MSVLAAGRSGVAFPAAGGTTRAAAAARVRPQRLPTLLLLAAAILCAAAIALPLWGMTLASVQYPEGLRMVVYPTRIVGDLSELNALNHYIGMAPITNETFAELRVLPLLFGAAAALCALAALVRRWWVRALPLVMLAGTGVYGLLRMRERLYSFGHDLDPMAPITIAPFTPPMLGSNTIAQFATYSYFGWGTALPLLASALVIGALWLGRRRAA